MVTKWYFVFDYSHSILLVVFKLQLLKVVQLFFIHCWVDADRLIANTFVNQLLNEIRRTGVDFLSEFQSVVHALSMPVSEVGS